MLGGCSLKAASRQEKCSHNGYDLLKGLISIGSKCSWMNYMIRVSWNRNAEKVSTWNDLLRRNPEDSDRWVAPAVTVKLEQYTRKDRSTIRIQTCFYLCSYLILAPFLLLTEMRRECSSSCVGFPTFWILRPLRAKIWSIVMHKWH